MHLIMVTWLIGSALNYIKSCMAGHYPKQYWFIIDMISYKLQWKSVTFSIHSNEVNNHDIMWSTPNSVWWYGTLWILHLMYLFITTKCAVDVHPIQFCSRVSVTHDNVMAWKCFLYYWPFMKIIRCNLDFLIHMSIVFVPDVNPYSLYFSKWLLKSCYKWTLQELDPHIQGTWI